jgi:hypothetical protein
LPRLLALGAPVALGRGERLVERPVARFAWFAAAALLLLAIERVGFRRRREVANRLEAPADARPRRAGRRWDEPQPRPSRWRCSAEETRQSDWARGDRVS